MVWYSRHLPVAFGGILIGERVMMLLCCSKWCWILVDITFTLHSYSSTRRRAVCELGKQFWGEDAARHRQYPCCFVLGQRKGATRISTARRCSSSSFVKTLSRLLILVYCCCIFARFPFSRFLHRYLSSYHENIITPSNKHSHAAALYYTCVVVVPELTRYGARGDEAHNQSQGRSSQLAVRLRTKRGADRARGSTNRWVVSLSLQSIAVVLVVVRSPSTVMPLLLLEQPPCLCCSMYVVLPPSENRGWSCDMLCRVHVANEYHTTEVRRYAVRASVRRATLLYLVYLYIVFLCRPLRASWSSVVEVTYC